MVRNEEQLKAADKPADTALQLHAFYRGKVQVMPKCSIRDYNDFAIWYTPGVAAPCRAISRQPELVYEYTNKANSIAIVSDGTRVLGLGDIGPAAGLPVMEGKSLLFKYLGGVDAVPLCLNTTDADELIRTVQTLELSFGGINLEDISQPKCFYVLDQLRSKLQIPVWHDDQQGSATVLLAGLLNALKVVGKQLENIKIGMIGMGAANVATYRLLRTFGVDPAAIVACDRSGTLHRQRSDIAQRQDIFADKWRVCCDTNEEQVKGGIAETLRGADVCIAFSAPGPHVIRPEWIQTMADRSVVFACSNPVPEIWPWEAQQAGAHIVATGRSDMPNQVNNSLGFPGIFRGVLDVRARTITKEMTVAATRELAQFAESRGLDREHIVPRMDDWEVFPSVAAATGSKAVEQGIALLPRTRQELLDMATATIKRAREAAQVLLAKGLMRPRQRINYKEGDDMSIGRICIREVHLADPEETIQVAARRMNDRNVGTLFIQNENAQPIGIITDRDVAIRVVGEALDPAQTTVADVMTKAPDSVYEDAPIETALAHMRAGPYRRLPVVDNEGKLVGVVSLDDILELICEEFSEIGQLLQQGRPRTLT